MLKVGFLNTRLFKSYLGVLSIISLFCSFAFVVITIPDNRKLLVGIGLASILLLIYFVMWVVANCLTKTTLNINNSKMVVRIGDIFKEDELKVVAFNEYFDTLVDNRIISSHSLNGMYISSKITDLDELDNLIDQDQHLNENVIEHNDNRPLGKKRSISLVQFSKMMISY